MSSAYDNYKPRSLAGEQTKWQGFWITSERFYHLPACRQYGYDRKPQFNSEIQNIHTFYKKDFDVKEKEVKRAKLFISADDLYKLYLNGSFVGEGPAQSYPFAYNYNCYDVTELLQGGEKKLYITPHLEGAPDKIKLELPLPEGRVLASYEYCNGKRTYSVKAPDAYEIIFKGEDVDFIRS